MVIINIDAYKQTIESWNNSKNSGGMLKLDLDEYGAEEFATFVSRLVEKSTSSDSVAGNSIQNALVTAHALHRSITYVDESNSESQGKNTWDIMGDRVKKREEERKNNMDDRQDRSGVTMVGSTSIWELLGVDEGIECIIHIKSNGKTQVIAEGSDQCEYFLDQDN